ncbi:hypothetical protein OIU84_009066 [Salix udensis]|uniref:Sulfhydryl oxidase n=1 Tax=Salix udensis TaxID=889485 RepID=A0AAD6JRZ9_9ROSI|nr:hypothetical protein OIU84_009066 [Salix udensis]
MSDNPWQHLFQNVSNCIQTQLANFTGQPQKPSSSTSKNTLFSLSPSSSHVSSKIYPANRDTSSVQPKDVLNKGKSAAPLTKEELGRATWTFLHTLAAQYPEHPTRQQKKDVKELMAILSRMYPCQECADHFKEVIKYKRGLFTLYD